MGEQLFKYYLISLILGFFLYKIARIIAISQRVIIRMKKENACKALNIPEIWAISLMSMYDFIIKKKSYSKKSIRGTAKYKKSFA